MEVAPIIWINGFPGLGKLTVAKELLVLLDSERTKLIDNHQLIDPVEARVSRDHPDYQKERKRERELVFDQLLKDQERSPQTIIFTDFQSSNELGRLVATEYKDHASKSGRPFLPIYLVCEVEENIRRITSPKRAASGTTKLLDAEILRAMYERSELYVFAEPSGFSLDVTNLQPGEAAMAIANYIKQQNRSEQNPKLTA